MDATTYVNNNSDLSTNQTAHFVVEILEGHLRWQNQEQDTAGADDDCDNKDDDDDDDDEQKQGEEEEAMTIRNYADALKSVRELEKSVANRNLGELITSLCKARDCLENCDIQCSTKQLTLVNLWNAKEN